jgi:hypothetical protein
LLSLHCAAEVQQFGTGTLLQTLFVQLSVVQALLSLHCAADVQQFGMGVLVHWFIAVLQPSRPRELLPRVREGGR